jgi:hypothetical protein
VFALHVTLPVTSSGCSPLPWLRNPFPGVTVAVNVTLCPYTDGFVLLPTDVLVVAALTV